MAATSFKRHPLPQQTPMSHTGLPARVYVPPHKHAKALGTPACTPYKDVQFRGDTNWAHFSETLRMLTSLDVCQPPPLRNGLARLWTAYLCSGETSQLMSAASWLLDQLRTLKDASPFPPQTAVFAECAGLVFVEFFKYLLPMAQDAASKFITLCQNPIMVLPPYFCSNFF